MKKFSMLFLAAAVALVGAIVAPTKAEAVPAFARQVGVPCYSCHFQHIPKLNAFGREFKLGGFTQSAQDLIQDDGLSLPPAFGAAVVAKFRLQNQYPEHGGTTYGQWDLPDEAGLLVGGRVAENFGTLFEFAIGGGEIGGTKFIYSKDFGGIRGGVTLFTTKDQGPGYGMELFNTGAQRAQFGFETSEATVRGGLNGAWNNAASGLTFFAGNDLFFANVGLVAPAAGQFSGGLSPDVGINFGQYLRAAITPKLGDGMDLMVGLQYTGGKIKVKDLESPGNPTGELSTDSMQIDAQLQTAVAGMSLEVIANFAQVKHANDSCYNTNPNDASGMSVAATLGVTKHAGVKLGYGSMDNGAAANNKYTATMVGGWIAFAQNIDLSIDYVTASGDGKPYETKSRAMLEFAF